MLNKILITGGSGFVGKNLNIDNALRPSSKELNLLDSQSVDDYFKNNQVDCVIHLSALCGGIGLNQRRPFDLTNQNLKMNVNLFDAIVQYNIEYLYSFSSVCGYPTHCPVPFKEKDMWLGAPEITNRGYGEMKRMLVRQFQTCKQQYGVKGAVFVPTNIYGIKDHFDLENSHVVPALIRKFVEAVEKKEKQVPIWGSGSASRDLVFIQDIVDAVVKAVEIKLDYPEPINLGTGRDISIKDLAKMIAKLCGYQGEIVFNSDMPDGQPKRMLDVSRAKQVLGWEAQTALLEGLVRTITWYEDKKD